MATETAVRNEMTEYWDAGFLAAEARPGAFYDLKKLPAITQASHYRRMALLDALPLGDLSDKVVVDYGVGPWGFACVFPKLHACREAIGIDLSILMATPVPDYTPRRARETEFAHTSPAVTYSGDWDKCTLHGPLTAAMAKGPESRLAIEFEGDGLIVFLWSHPWCSRVRMWLDGALVERAVYNPLGGFVQQRWLALSPGRHTLEMAAGEALEPAAKGRNLMFWKAISIDRGGAATAN